MLTFKCIKKQLSEKERDVSSQKESRKINLYNTAITLIRRLLLATFITHTLEDAMITYEEELAMDYVKILNRENLVFTKKIADASI